MHGLRGTEQYIAPEIREDVDNLQMNKTTASRSNPMLHKPKGYSPFKSDVFSLGVLIFELLAGQSPFNHANAEKDRLFRLIAEDNWHTFWQAHEALIGCNSDNSPFKPEFKQLIEGVLAVDPLKRWSIEKTKQAKWLSGAVFEDGKIRSWLVEVIRKKNSTFMKK